MEVRGDGYEWRGGGRVEEGRDGCSPYPSPPFPCLIPVGLAGGEGTENGKEDPKLEY